MEFWVWLSLWTIPLTGWWWVQKSRPHPKKILNEAVWGADFRKDFLKSVIAILLLPSARDLQVQLKESRLPWRVHLLWLGLSSLTYSWTYLLLFVVLFNVPSSVLLLVALVFFIAFRWRPSLKAWAYPVLGLAIFEFGFENLVRSSAQWTQASEPADWVFWWSANYFKGALLGALVGAVIRVITRVSGASWWTGLSLLISGVGSLAFAWGCVLGDILADAFETHSQKNAGKAEKHRAQIAIAIGLVFLLVSGFFQKWIQYVFIEAYSVQLRAFQLAVMVLAFLAVDTFSAMAFFHFYHVKHPKN